MYVLKMGADDETKYNCSQSRPQSCHARCWVKVYTRGPLKTRMMMGKWLITKSRQNPIGRQKMTERARQKSQTGVAQARGVVGGSCEGVSRGCKITLILVKCGMECFTGWIMVTLDLPNPKCLTSCQGKLHNSAVAGSQISGDLPNSGVFRKQHRISVLFSKLVKTPKQASKCYQTFKRLQKISQNFYIFVENT